MTQPRLFEGRTAVPGSLIVEGLSGIVVIETAPERGADALGLRICPEGPESEVTPAVADPLVRAARSLCHLDARVKRVLLAGREVHTRIPMGDPPPLPVRIATGSAEEYWRLRMPAAYLIRPVLLTPAPQDHLFPYQRAGALWLHDHNRAILADDMGLGKTLQAITALRKLITNGELAQALVLCPASLIGTWEDELTKWAPELGRLRVTPPASDRTRVWDLLRDRVHVLVANYEQVRNPPSSLRSRLVGLVIADEAHRIRNLSAAVTRGVMTLKSVRFWALTGTPIERDARDLATLLSVVEPKRFTPSDHALGPATLRAQARPYVLRRRKVEVLTDLPPVIDVKEPLDLTAEQRSAYRLAAAKAIAESPTGGQFLALINELRSICDLDPSSGRSCKIDRIGEILTDIRAAGEKAVVFSYLLEPLTILAHKLDARGVQHVRIDGTMEPDQRQAAVALFRQNPELTVLLASSRVGGEGLTLTEANHVVFLNEWWNPSSNDQARDRIVRIGQHRVVSVHRFMCRATIEETLDQILRRKASTFTDIIERLAQPTADASQEPVAGVLRQLQLAIRDQEAEASPSRHSAT
jgi:SNF2 family DNA or RNA helicase